MSAALLLAVLLLAGLVVMAIFIAPDIRDAFEEAYGDVPNVPEELAAPKLNSRAGSGREPSAAVEVRVALHDGGGK